MKTLSSEGPTVDPTARIIDSTLGRWTEVGARTSVVESEIGDYSYVVHDAQIIYATVGRFCSIASHTRINPGNHPLDRVALHHFTYRSAQYGMGDDDATFFNWRRQHRVTLGHDVWIGHGAVILPGISIGTGAAIGAGAVVSKNVPDFCVVGGVPARTIRMRFSEEVIAGLLDIAWWHWPDEQIEAALRDIRTLPAETFIARYRDCAA